jgi:hypothetical protein
MKNNREYMGVIEHETVDTHETISSVDTQKIHKKRTSMKAIREEKANQPYALDHFLNMTELHRSCVDTVVAFTIVDKHYRYFIADIVDWCDDLIERNGHLFDETDKDFSDRARELVMRQHT